MDVTDVAAVAVATVSVGVSVWAVIVARSARADSRRSADAGERSAEAAVRSADAAEEATALSRRQLNLGRTPRFRLTYLPHNHPTDEPEGFELAFDGPEALTALEIRLSPHTVDIVDVRGFVDPDARGVTLGADMALHCGSVDVGETRVFWAEVAPGHGDVQFLALASIGSDKWTVPVTTHLEGRGGPRTRPYQPRSH